MNQQVPILTSSVSNLLAADGKLQSRAVTSAFVADIERLVEKRGHDKNYWMLEVAKALIENSHADFKDTLTEIINAEIHDDDEMIYAESAAALAMDTAEALNSRVEGGPYIDVDEPWKTARIEGTT